MDRSAKTPPFLNRGMRRTAILAALALFLGAAASAAVSVSASAYSTTGCKYNYNSVGVNKGSMYNSDYTTAANRAIYRWDLYSDVNTYQATSGAVTAFTENLNNTNIDGQSNWYCVGGVTSWSNARLNTQTTTGFVTEKKVTVFLHELGHALGLSHSGVASAVMYSCAACAYNNYGSVIPQSDDRLGMNTLY